MAASSTEQVNAPPQIERLTPQEMQSKLDIYDAIMAIPCGELRGHLKPQVMKLMDRCGCGRRTSYASHATLAFDTGVSLSVARKHRDEIMAGGWFVEIGRRGKDKYARADLVPGPRLIANIRDYARRVEERKARRQEGWAAPTGGNPPKGTSIRTCPYGGQPDLPLRGASWLPLRAAAIRFYHPV